MKHTWNKIAAYLRLCTESFNGACSDGNTENESYTGKPYEAEILTPGEIVVGISADYPPMRAWTPPPAR